VLSGCCKDVIVRKQINIPENLLTKCDEIKKFSEFSKTSTIEDHIEYSKFLMEAQTACRIGKDDLIKAVRIEQDVK
jgi:hypothetical protein